MAELPPAVAVAVKPGHNLKADSPHELSRVRRWTCQNPGCGCAVLVNEGRVYGSATEVECKSSCKEAATP